MPVSAEDVQLQRHRSRRENKQDPAFGTAHPYDELEAFQNLQEMFEVTRDEALAAFCFVLLKERPVAFSSIQNVIRLDVDGEIFYEIERFPAISLDHALVCEAEASDEWELVERDHLGKIAREFADGFLTSDGTKLHGIKKFEVRFCNDVANFLDESGFSLDFESDLDVGFTRSRFVTVGDYEAGRLFDAIAIPRRVSHSERVIGLLTSMMPSENVVMRS